METLIAINDTAGPWLSEIAFAFYWATLFFLGFIFLRFRNREAFIVAALLTVLVWLGNTQGMWLEPFYLAMAHTFLFSGLLAAHVFWDVLKNGYGDLLLTFMGWMCLADVLFYVTDWPIQYHAWLMLFLFLAMCILTMYACKQAHDNNGKLGKYLSVSSHQVKENSKAV